MIINENELSDILSKYFDESHSYLFILSTKLLLEKKLSYYIDFYLSDEECNKFNGIVNLDSALQYLANRVLVKSVLSELTGIEVSELKFIYNEHGKPFLDSKYSLNFNLSNTLSISVMALCHDECGVDVECISRKISIPVAYENYCDSEILNLEKENFNAQRFWEYWTLKEAFLKCSGLGLSRSMKSFSFDIYEDEILFEDYIEDNLNSSFVFNRVFVDNNIISLARKSKKEKDIRVFKYLNSTGL